MTAESLLQYNPLSEESTHSENYCAIPADHPCFAGHFPSNPITPGVVLLEAVIEAFAAWQPHHSIIGIPIVKFLAPLRPDHRFTIRFTESSGRRLGLAFECGGDDDRPLARGYLTIALDRKNQIAITL